MADGSIRINTKIDNSESSKGMKDLEKSADACARHVKDAFNSIDSVKGCESAIKKQVTQWQRAKDKADEYEKKLEEVNAKLRAMEQDAFEQADIGFKDDTNEKIKNRADSSLENNKDYQKLIDQSIALEDAWTVQNQKMNTANANVQELESTLERVKSGAGSTGKEISRLGKFTNSLKGIASKIGSVFSSGFGKAKSAASRFFKSVMSSSTNGINSIKRMAMAVVGIRAAYSLARKATDQYLQSNEEASNRIAAIWNTLGAIIGPFVDMVISAVTTALSYINALVKTLTGIDFVARANSKALKKQATATKGVAKATKEANTQLASFDEMNKLEDTSSSGSSGGGGAGGSGASLFEPIDVDTSWINGLKEAFDKGAYELGKYLGESLNKVMASIDWEPIKKGAQEIGRNIALFLNGAIDGIDWSLLGKTIGEGLNTVLNLVYGFVSTFNFRKFGEAIGTAFDSCFKTIDWKMLADTVSQGVIGIFNTISGALSAVDWSNIGSTLMNCILSIDWGGIISAIAESIILTLKSVVDLILGALGELVSSLPSLTDDIFKWVDSIDWSSLGSTLGSYIADILLQLIDLILNTNWFEVIVNVVKIIGDAILGVIDFLIGVVESVIKDIWDTIKSNFTYENMLKWIKGVVKSIQDGIKDISKWFDEKFNAAYDAICEIFSDIGQWFGDRAQDICNAVNFINTWFNDKFDAACKAIKNIFSGIGKWFGDRYNDICNSFNSIGEWFRGKFDSAWNLIKGIFSPNAVTTFFSGCWKNIKGAFGNVADWFRGTFASAWQAVKNVFSSGGKIFDGIKDGILNGLKAVINALISGINRVIKIPFDGINSALKAIKRTDILGFKPFSWIGTISVPSIPKLARGGIVNNPTLFQAGEAGKEAVLPLQNNTQWMQDLADFINSQRKGDDEKEINLYIDGERFFRWLIKKQKDREFAMNG